MVSEPHFLHMNPKEYDMLMKTKEQNEAIIFSQERSRLVKKKRHGTRKVLIPVGGDMLRGRGGKKSRRRGNSFIWVDPELIEQNQRPTSRRPLSRTR